MLTYRRAESEGGRWPTKSAAVLAATSALAHPVRRSWTIERSSLWEKIGGIHMNVDKVLIRGVEIPMKKGILGLSETTIEVELAVHPTVADFIDTLGLLKENVSIYPKKHAEIKGRFEVHTGPASVLLTGSLKDTEGAEDLASASKKKSLYLLHPSDEVSLNNELKTNQLSIFTTFLQSLLENEIKDEGNRLFISTLVEKLTNGEKLNFFDRFIKDEISFILEAAMSEK